VAACRFCKIVWFHSLYLPSSFTASSSVVRLRLVLITAVVRMFVGRRSLSVNVYGRSSLDCGYQVPSKLFAASLTHMSFGWQTGELFVGRAAT
jgi:hypothetical protein